MSLPPRYVPARNLDLVFAADPFDPRMIRNTAGRELTPLGCLLNAWHWYETHKVQVGAAFAPIACGIRECLARECPDVFVEETRDKQ